MKLSRTCTCLWPLPCDGVTAPHGRIPLTKGLLWAPVQQGDEITLMASTHLAFLLLQLFLVLLQRCSCLWELLNWSRRGFGFCLPSAPYTFWGGGAVFPRRPVTQARQTLAVLCGHVWVSGQALLLGQTQGSRQNSKRWKSTCCTSKNISKRMKLQQLFHAALNTATGLLEVPHLHLICSGLTFLARGAETPQLPGVQPSLQARGWGIGRAQQPDKTQFSWISSEKWLN